LKQAVANAKSKADIAASALRLNVMGVKSINIDSVGGFHPSPPQPFFAQETAGAVAAPTAGPPTPIIAGEQEVTSSEDITFLIG
jgi:uncharacterized protein